MTAVPCHRCGTPVYWLREPDSHRMVPIEVMPPSDHSGDVLPVFDQRSFRVVPPEAAFRLGDDDRAVLRRRHACGGRRVA